jgi:hypothetical protein
VTVQVGCLSLLLSVDDDDSQEHSALKVQKTVRLVQQAGGQQKILAVQTAHPAMVSSLHDDILCAAAACMHG